ncbi:unnamed protein product [Brachionus calyciflorus]|uniref:Uncharacterized protein n=1 Tax=Brachionus calyciflorus TaxID=104777 RepID=A0A814M3K6_9BILA|nr:unnamed protein product [Brachionus calyciflorus]
MSGQYKGLAARVKTDAPQAVYVQCYAHRLNFAFQDACRAVTEVSETMENVNAVYRCIEGSSKRKQIFEQIQLELKDSKLKLANFCETRWCSRFSALKALNENFRIVLEALTEIKSIDKNSTQKPGVRGKLNLFSKMSISRP